MNFHSTSEISIIDMESLKELPEARNIPKTNGFVNIPKNPSRTTAIDLLGKSIG